MSLRDEYRGVSEALPDVLVASDITSRLHRPVGDGDVWCSSRGDEFDYVETEIALAYGAPVCRSCFGAAMEYLARTPSSPVERADGEEVRIDTPADQLAPEIVDERLDALTAEVLVAVGGRSSTTFHAPVEGDEPVCDASANFARRAVDKTSPSARPCRDCFSDEVVKRYGGRDADRRAVAAVGLDFEPR